MKNPAHKILIFTQTLESGGAEKQAVLLANLLSGLFSVRIIVFYGNRMSERTITQVANEVELVLLYGNNLWKIYKLTQIFNESKPYILFNYLLLPNVLGSFVSNFVSEGISIGGIRSALQQEKKFLINRFVHNRISNLTIFNNYSGYKRYTSRGFKSEKAIVIPNSIEISNDELIRKENRIPKVLSVGRFEKVKDYLTALKSVKKVLDNGKQFTYTIVGWGSLEKQIYQWIDELGIKNEIVKIVINPCEIDQYYKEADIYLQTSLVEGLSNSVLEAMSFSLPLIVTNVGDNNRLVQNSVNGFLNAPKDSESIAECLNILISDHDKRIRYGRNSYKIVKENYSIESMKKRYLYLINQFDDIGEAK